MTRTMMGRALCAALAVFALVGCSGKAKVRQPAELQDIVSPQVKPHTAWTAHAGDGSGRYYGELRATVEPDAVFTADAEGRVYAFDPKTGHRIWRVDVDKRVIAGPSVSGNALFVGTRDGEVIALKRDDGGRYWSRSLSSEVLAAPVSNGDTVVARSGDGRVYGLSAVSGQQLWTFDRLVPALTLRGLSDPVIAGRTAVVGMDNGRIAGIRMIDGKAVWEQLVAAPTGRNELERLVDIDANLLQDGREIYAVSFGGELACLDSETGQVLWRRSIKSYSGMARINDLVVVTDESGVVWGLDARTGAAAWRNEDLKYRRLSAPGVFDGKVVVGDFEGYLHWLDASDGRLVGRKRMGDDPIRVAPVAQDGLMYVMNTTGRLAAIRDR